MKAIRLNIFTLFLILNSFFLINAEQHKIVYLISPPRSLSVAFLRMMQARGDFKILHEPSQWAFIKNFDYDLTKDWFKKDAATTFEQVKTQILNAAQDSNVFVKEMSFTVKDFFLNNREILESPQVYFIFLLRNPHHSIISAYLKANEIVKGFDYIVGYESCFELFEHIKNHATNKPCIVLSENLYQQPEQMTKNICNFLSIPFLEHSLCWDNMENKFDGSTWHEIKYDEHALHWHGDAIASTGFHKPKEYKVDENNQPTFEEVENLKHRNECIKTYIYNLPFYHQLINQVEYILQ